MNLHEQIGALEASVDDLIEAAAASAAASSESAESAVPAESAAGSLRHGSDATESSESTESSAADGKPTLRIDRPNQNEIVMTIGDQSVRLHPMQVGQLVEELSNARASMQPEAPANLPPGWRFVSTKNPVMAVQKQSNGDRLLVMRHTGHGWVPFTFSPDMAIQLYMMLTQA